MGEIERVPVQIKFDYLHLKASSTNPTQHNFLHILTCSLQALTVRKSLEAASHLEVRTSVKADAPNAEDQR